MGKIVKFGDGWPNRETDTDGISTRPCFLVNSLSTSPRLTKRARCSGIFNWVPLHPVNILSELCHWHCPWVWNITCHAWWGQFPFHATQNSDDSQSHFCTASIWALFRQSVWRMLLNLCQFYVAQSIVTSSLHKCTIMLSTLAYYKLSIFLLWAPSSFSLRKAMVLSSFRTAKTH